ncbi:MAG TPA: hypothetical protein PKW03_03730 [Acetivibrio sp.]|nr:hypothetical protein [Acetivibrio sp.]
MADVRYIVFRCYSTKPIYTFSKSIIGMINLLDSINNKGEYYLRHNLSKNSSQKKISSKNLETFLKKLEDQKVMDFEFICRLKDVDSDKIFPFRFQITYDNHRIYSTEAFGRGGSRIKTLMPGGEFRIEVCIQSHLVPEDLFSKFETAFKELYISSDSSYGFWDMMDMRDALFSKRSIYERKLILERGVAGQYKQRVAGVFAGNFLNPAHMEMFKGNFSDIMKDCKYEELTNGSFYLKLGKSQEEAIIRNTKFDQILPKETEPYADKTREAYILKPSHIEKLGGIDVIKKCLPDKASLVQYEGRLILIYKNEDRNDVNELVAFLYHLVPFRMHRCFSVSKNFADKLIFIYSKEDKCDICLNINLNESMSTIPFNLVNSKSNSEFCNLKKIIADWISSCGEEPQIYYDEKNDILKWNMNLSNISDVKIIHLYSLLNEYAVENKIFAFCNIGAFIEEGLPLMRRMAIDGYYVTY